jgi:transcriptional regulator with XRE-family HTH domain
VRNLPVRIDGLRVCFGISMRELSARSKVSKSYLFKALRYESFPPTLWLVERLAEGLGVSPATLFSPPSPLDDPFVQEIVPYVRFLSQGYKEYLVERLRRFREVA